MPAAMKVFSTRSSRSKGYIIALPGKVGGSASGGLITDRSLVQLGAA